MLLDELRLNYECRMRQSTENLFGLFKRGRKREGSNCIEMMEYPKISLQFNYRLPDFSQPIVKDFSQIIDSQLKINYEISNQITAYSMLCNMGADSLSQSMLKQFKLFEADNMYSSNPWIDKKLDSFSSKVSAKARDRSRLASTMNVNNGAVIVMTEVCWNTMGDFYAAYRLIRALKAIRSVLNITWVVMTSDSKLPAEAQIADEMIVVPNWDELIEMLSLNEEKLLKYFQEAALILQFPTFHFFPENLYKLLEMARESNEAHPILNVLEYDYHMKIGLSTGLGHDSLGVFLNRDILTRTKAVQQDPLFNIDSEDPTLKVLVGAQSIQEYRNNNMLFFSYFNREARSVLAGGFANYLRIIIMYCAKYHPNKNIDVIAPFTFEQYAEIHRSLSTHVCSVEMISKSGSEKKEVNPAAKSKLRIINHFRLSNDKFLQWMESSHPFKQVTGDQSFSDLLSVRGGLPFYQVMTWKSGVMAAFLQLVSEQFGKYSKLFLLLVCCVRCSDLHEDVESVASMLHSQEVYQQMDALRDWLFENKNLYDTLPSRLLKLVDQFGKPKEPSVMFDPTKGRESDLRSLKVLTL